MNDIQIEAEIQEKKLVAPRVTMSHIESAIDEEIYQRIEGTTITICVLRMKNGFSVTGESACISPENFDVDLGKKIAKQKALDKCWELFGFHLASLVSGWTMDS